jgi:hypothetical protein
MSYTMNGEQYCELTKTTSKELASKVWKKRESEIVLGLFKVGLPGERTTFEHLCSEFERSHFAGLTENTVRGHRTYLKQLKSFFGEQAGQNYRRNDRGVSRSASPATNKTQPKSNGQKEQR